MEHPEVFLELGTVLLGLAVLSRLAGRIGMPTIPLYLTAGLAFGEGGVAPLVTTESFVELGAEIGVVLLLFMLGLEYGAAELTTTLRRHAPIGAIDVLFNFTPGFIAGLLLGWGLVLAVILGGVTYVSSSGIIAKILSDQGWAGLRGSSVVVSTLIIEDLAMVLYLPIAGALLVGGTDLESLLPALAGVLIIVVVLSAAAKLEVGLSRFVFSRSDESLLLTILGVTILVAGAAELFGVSAAVAALLVGILMSGAAAEAAHDLLKPMRDLFAAIFFAFVGLSVDPASIPPVLLPAAILAVVTAATKFATGWVGAGMVGVERRGRIRAGTMLIARGEFSIAIVGLVAASGGDRDFRALALSYVFLLAIGGPIAVRLAESLDRPDTPEPEKLDASVV